jgi:hypothetical protein
MGWCCSKTGNARFKVTLRRVRVTVLAVEEQQALHACNETELMHYLSSLYSVTIPLHVAGFLVTHHQEVKMYICNHWYVLYVLVDCQLACLEWNCYIYGYVSPGLLIQHAKRMRPVISSSVTCPVLPYFSTLPHKRNDFRKKMLFNIKMYVLIFSKTSKLFCSKRNWARYDHKCTFMCQLSWNLGTLTSCNPLGLSRPLMGLLYLFHIGINIKYLAILVRF